MNQPRPSGRLRFLLGLLAACLLASTTPGHAQGLWSEYAMVSATLGVHDGRICVGEANRGDLGCPLHAPQVLASGLLSATNISATGSFSATSNVSVGSRLYFTRSGVNPAYIEMTPSGDNSDSVAIWTRYGGYTKNFEIKSDRIFLSPWGTGNEGRVGIRNTTPTTSLHVSGTIRISYSGEACDADRTGAIRYTNGDFEFCRDGTIWQTLANVADSAAPDRIVSGTTTMVVVSSTGFISLTQGATNTGWFDPQRGLVTLGVSSTGPISGTNGYFNGTLTVRGVINIITGTGVVAVGQGAAQENTSSYVTAIGLNAGSANFGSNVTGVGYAAAQQNTGNNVTAVGHHAARQNTGANVTSLGVNAAYQNTGANVVAIGYEAGRNNAVANQFILRQSMVNSMPLMQGDFSTGNLGIGTTSPTASLDVSGTVSTTLLKLAADPVASCTNDTLGTVKIANGRVFVCRP